MTGTNGRAHQKDRADHAPGDGRRRSTAGLCQFLYSQARTVEVGRILQDNGISHYEEPRPYWEFAQTREVTEWLDIDVTDGEQSCMMECWQSMTDDRVVDVLQLDICYLGGLCRTLRVTRMTKTSVYR